jgi:hypothetical protein
MAENLPYRVFLSIVGKESTLGKKPGGVEKPLIEQQPAQKKKWSRRTA